MALNNLQRLMSRKIEQTNLSTNRYYIKKTLKYIEDDILIWKPKRVKMTRDTNLKKSYVLY